MKIEKNIGHFIGCSTISATTLYIIYRYQDKTLLLNPYVAVLTIFFVVVVATLISYYIFSLKKQEPRFILDKGGKQ